MLDRNYFNKIKKNILQYAVIRREVIKQSGDALHLAKRAIFAGQKDDLSAADGLLQDAEKIFLILNKKIRQDSRITSEGAYQAALEEFTEARVFLDFLRDKKIGGWSVPRIPPEIYVAGLADVPGELYRYAVRAATERRRERVMKCLATAEEIIETLLNMDLTGYHRQKFDQAKAAAAKIEQVVYDLSLRQ